MVAEEVPNCEVAFASGASADARDYRVDFTKIQKQLPSFKPAWTLRQGIQELYDAYKAAGLTQEQFVASPRYYRLRTVKGLIERGLVDRNLRRQAAGVGQASGAAGQQGAR